MKKPTENTTLKTTAPGLICGGLGFLSLIIAPNAFFGLLGVLICLASTAFPRRILNLAILLVFLSPGIAIAKGSLLPLLLLPVGVYFTRQELKVRVIPPTLLQTAQRELREAKALFDSGVYNNDEYAAAVAKINREYGAEITKQG